MGSSADEGEILDAGSVPRSNAESRLHRTGSGVDSLSRNGSGGHAAWGDAGQFGQASFADSRPSRSPEQNTRHPSGHGWDRRGDHNRFSGRGRGRDDVHPCHHSNARSDRRMPDDGPRQHSGHRVGDGYRKRDWTGNDCRHLPEKRARYRSRSPPIRPDCDDLTRGQRGHSATYGHRESLSYKEASPYQAGNEAGSSRSLRVATSGPMRPIENDGMRNAKLLQESASTQDDEMKQGDRPETSDNLDTAASQDDGVELEVIDEDAEIERRRRRREAILAKSSSATPLLGQALRLSDLPATSLDNAQPASGRPSPAIGMWRDIERTELESWVADITDPASPVPRGDVDSPSSFEFEQAGSIINARNSGTEPIDDGPSAADYDPTADMWADGRRDEMRQGHVSLHGQALILLDDQTKAHYDTDQLARDKPEISPVATAATLDNGDKKEDDEFDMFAEDFDDEKYAAHGKPTQQGSGPQLATAAAAAAATAVGVPAAIANANADGAILEGDDQEGYYKIRPGEVLDGRYQIQAALGKGMFSSVIRALDLETNKLVAVKMMRNNDALRKGGLTEVAILQKLNEADPDDRRHIVRFENHFEFKGHLCLAFEHLSMNLREVLRKFGNNVGINIAATRAYAHQMFVALTHMRRCSIVHADIKPDNILVSENRNVVKICDLGTAIDRSDAATALNVVTPYLVSRFYRAPELILGMPYDYGVDTWSVGCTLYELYTGKILFTGDSNNQMLRAIQETRGRIMPKLLKRGQLSALHFDDMGRFLSAERDKFGKTVIKTLSIIKPTRDLRTRLMTASQGLSDAEAKDAGLFLDLLEQCLVLNPDKRIQPADALKHPFFTTKGTSSRK